MPISIDNKVLNIAVTGYKGRLGSQLIYCGCDPLDCDITDIKSIRKAIEEVKPDVIINCAAFTDVDACETKEGFERALKVNTEGPQNIRYVFTGNLIHLSTDYIFDENHGPYREDNKKKNPVNSYGYSKWGGEILLTYPLHESKKTCVVRTTGLYGGLSYKPDFAHYIIDKLQQNHTVLVTKELIGNQTYIPHLAVALLKLAMMDQYEYPVLHIASSDVMSRYDFVLMIANAYKLNKNLLIPCKNKDVGWKAARPRRAGLNTNLAKKLRLPIYTVLDGIRSMRDDTRRV